LSLIDKKKVEEVLNSIRPYLQADEGDIELVNITENGIVEVKLLGACNECPLSVMTLRAGVERTLIKEIPDIKRVESIN
jgi:Fe-S cluster biogenesis protein NfuA